MSDVAINQVLAQMRSMAAAAGSGMEGPAETGSGPEFSTLMRESIRDVNEAMQQSKEMTRAFEAGDPDVSLAQLMVTAQKASLEFAALSEVRNKLLTAYRDVMNMQV
jgi:flagellar hook-basal body complex protein FliE